ncbi:MAG: protein kinase [Cyanobacteria bacterium REEB67]|nr:protein kinase [Cyanobacteria bacterium REEB67]
MKQSPEAPLTCKKCGKPRASRENRGDLVAHLLQDNFCSCDKTLVRRPVPAAAKRSAAEPSAAPGDNDDFCPRCGLKAKNQSLPGSLTGYLFQDVRCKCLSEADFAPGAMTGKFWNLKKRESGKTFNKSTSKDHLDQHLDDTQSKATTINLASGAIIGGAYRILNLIGRGGMGEVYLAEHITLGKRCALKLIPPDQVTELGWRRFQQEARAIAKLEHINLVKVSDLGIHEGCLPFYAMEYIEGETLSDMLARYGPMPVKTAIEIFMQICDGVHDAHKAGVVHRDLKPANIMVSQAANGKLIVKVLDFGLAKINQQDREKQSLTSIGEIFGSPFYMSPEQCAGEKVDNRSDIYSLGCTLFECLTGRPPFNDILAAAIVLNHQESAPPTLASILGSKTVPDSMDVVMAKLLRKNPVERYQTLTELRGDLERVARGETVQPFYMSRTRSSTAESNETDTVNGTTASARRSAKEKLFAAGLGVVLAAGLGFAYTMIKPLPKLKKTVLAAVADSDLKSGRMTDQVIESEIQNSFGVANRLPLEKIRSTAKARTQGMRGNIEDSGGSLFREIGKEIQGAEPDSSAPGPKSYAESEPYSRVSRIGQTNYLIFNFPTDTKLGGIGVYPDKDMVPAIGSIKILAEQKIKFAPGPMLTTYPRYFKRFRAGEISEIILDRPAEINKMFQALTQLPNYKSLTDFKINQPERLTVDSERILSTLTNLRKFSCNQECISPLVLVNMPFLKNLNNLALKDYADTDSIFEKLSSSTNLRELKATRCGISKAGLSSLAKIPSLIKLELEENLDQTDQIRALAEAPALYELYASKKLPLNAETLKLLQTFKHLKKLHLGGPKDVFDPLTRNRVKAALTGVRIFMGDGLNQNLLQNNEPETDLR